MEDMSKQHLLRAVKLLVQASAAGQAQVNIVPLFLSFWIEYGLVEHWKELHDSPFFLLVYTFSEFLSHLSNQPVLYILHLSLQATLTLGALTYQDLLPPQRDEEGKVIHNKRRAFELYQLAAEQVMFTIWPVMGDLKKSYFVIL